MPDPQTDPQSDPSPAVVITGCSTGIGRTTTRMLDREGWTVFAAVRKEADAASVREEFSERVHPLLLDVVDEAQIERAAKEVEARLGNRGLAGLVNNAGIGSGGPLEYVDLDAMRGMFDVNVFGPVAVTRAFLPLVRRARGRIVNVSSGAGKVSTPLLGPYCSSKFALEALSDALRVELRGAGIHVSIVEPGFIDTPMQTKGLDEVAEIENRLSEEALSRYGPALQKLRETFTRFAKNATPPEKVARRILDALTASRPRTRYTVGSDAALLSPLDRLLPDRAKDAIFGRLLGL